MPKSLKASTKLITHNLGRFLGKSRTRRHLITKFASKLGLVYFGSVDQHKDEHKVVGGFTVSQTHKDYNYCVGTVNDYDVTLVDRSDVALISSNRIDIHNWVIVSIELKTKADLPHFFVGARGHINKPYEIFFQKYPAIHQVHLGTFENYSPDFTSRFSIYCRPNMAIKLEKLFPNSAARVLGAHFWPFSIEQNEHTLYIYSTGQKITSNLLSVMLQNGLWLADYIDKQTEKI